MRKLSEVALASRDRTAVEAAVGLLRDLFPVERVILFGSKAKGTDDAESDIDLLVLTGRLLSWQERDAITDALFDVELAHDVVISTLVLPCEEWDRGPYVVLPIHQEVQEHGAVA